jgi:hypothetical protein
LTKIYVDGARGSDQNNGTDSSLPLRSFRGIAATFALKNPLKFTTPLIFNVAPGEYGGSDNCGLVFNVTMSTTIRPDPAKVVNNNTFPIAIRCGRIDLSMANESFVHVVRASDNVSLIIEGFSYRYHELFYAPPSTQACLAQPMWQQLPLCSGGLLSIGGLSGDPSFYIELRKLEVSDNTWTRSRVPPTDVQIETPLARASFVFISTLSSRLYPFESGAGLNVSVIGFVGRNNTIAVVSRRQLHVYVGLPVWGLRGGAVLDIALARVSVTSSTFAENLLVELEPVLHANETSLFDSSAISGPSLILLRCAPLLDLAYMIEDCTFINNSLHTTSANAGGVSVAYGGWRDAYTLQHTVLRVAHNTSFVNQSIVVFGNVTFTGGVAIAALYEPNVNMSPDLWFTLVAVLVSQCRFTNISIAPAVGAPIDNPKARCGGGLCCFLVVLSSLSLFHRRHSCS